MQPLEDSDPQEIGDYRLLKRLGAGGMGQVYLGQSPSHRLVAVKVIHRALAADPEFRDRFAREIAAVRQVSGAFTAPVVDADPHAVTPWLATVYIPGPTLEQAVKEHGPLPEHTVRTLGAGLCEALRDIHRAGLIHRDLKPGNVLLAEDGPRVIDFGIAHLVDGTKLTNTGMAIGTPGFWSPEQVENRELTPASDIFALGALLGFAAQGRLVFGNGHPLAQMRRVCDGDPDLTDIPDGLSALLNRCLAKDPGQRPDLTELLRMASDQPAPGVWLPQGVTELIAAKTRNVNHDATEVAAARATREYTEFAAAGQARSGGDAPSGEAPAPVVEQKAPGGTAPEVAFAQGQDLEKSGRQTEALEAYQAAADGGHTGAMFQLGVIYRDLLNDPNAAYWFRRAADADDTEAMIQLGLRAQTGGRAAEAESWFHKAEAAGAPDGTTHLGLLRQDVKDHAAAERLFRRAAENGSVGGMFHLAYLAAESGRSHEAEVWYRKAADAGNINSMINLGALIQDRDQHEAELWYRRAAEHGELEAHANLGRLYFLRENFTDAERHLARAANSGNPRAMGNYADVLVNLGQTEAAEAWYERAVDAGSTEDNISYGHLLYDQGRYVEAEHRYRAALENGHTDVILHLGDALAAQGRFRDAELQFRQAVDHGDDQARKSLADLQHRLGRAEEAREWSDSARSRGVSPEVSELMDQLLRNGPPGSPSEPSSPPPSASPAAQPPPRGVDRNTPVRQFVRAMFSVVLLGVVPIVQIPVGWLVALLLSPASGATYPGFFTGEGFALAVGLGYFVVNFFGMSALAGGSAYFMQKGPRRLGIQVGAAGIFLITALLPTILGML